MTQKFHFNTVDLYCWGGVSYQFMMSDEKFAYMKRADGSDAIERFSWPDIHEAVASKEWDIKRRPANIIEATYSQDPYMFVWELPDTQRTLVLNRWFIVSAVEKLYAQKKLKFTPKSVQENEGILFKEASIARRAFEGEFGKQYFSSKTEKVPPWPNACTILLWKRKYRNSGRRIEALVDRRGKFSSIDIDQESFAFINARLRKYLNDQEYSGNGVIRETLMDIERENERRLATGEPKIQTRCRSVLHEWLQKFGPFAIKAGRDGLTAAKHEYGGIGKTERATRPGECFQIDEWEVDARTFMMAGPLREGLDKKTLAALPRGRRWMYIVIDVATRYIVGFALSASQTPEAAVRALRMAPQNKDHLAKAAGAKNGWAGMQFESLQSDTGSAFFSEFTQRAVNTAFATYFYPTLGEPQLRGIIERVFGTFTDCAMPLIPARTFSNPQERGDYKTEDRVTLTDDQLALIFIRYIVDVYHQSSHFGLFDETPQNALNRLVGTVGKPPDLPKHIRRHAFGIRIERTLTRRGVRVLGIDFNSEEIVEARKQYGSPKCPVYVDPDSLGAISVYVKGKWIEVPNSIENFDGISVVEWNAVGATLRQRYAAEARVNFSVILAALTNIRSRVTDQQKIVGTLPQAPTSADFNRLENNLWHGLSIFDDTVDQLDGLPSADDGLGFIIGEPAPGIEKDVAAEKATPTYVDDTPIAEPDAGDSGVDYDTDWWQGDDDDV
ncbi:DDE-type integrase/transposase/recombinase [Roseibium sp. RKSG952]|uniref:DDE-type integrase/transposase/recombinase n=1 Tax=Roseibium sp. RKSG952 TaxID=2529384 RepID=UPI0018AD2A2C|nr:DDE-type integrase/transposase/recombinase [Roseibium sp. RKSG952]